MCGSAALASLYAGSAPVHAEYQARTLDLQMVQLLMRRVPCSGFEPVNLVSAAWHSNKWTTRQDCTKMFLIPIGNMVEICLILFVVAANYASGELQNLGCLTLHTYAR